MNFGFEKKKLDKIEAVAQELERGYKGGGGEQCYLELHPMFLSAMVPELWVHLFHNGISLRHAVYKTNRAIVFMSIFTQKHHTNNHLVRIWSV